MYGNDVAGKIETVLEMWEKESFFVCMSICVPTIDVLLFIYLHFQYVNLCEITSFSLVTKCCNVRFFSHIFICVLWWLTIKTETLYAIPSQ